MLTRHGQSERPNLMHLWMASSQLEYRESGWPISSAGQKEDL